ncbi:AHH domain-containing protein [Archangium violaceum]|uniref:Uncharacterized protein n=1 Tax=Archangium violaceum Cb vi76 TaxID=1406225 RepID=A0A084SHR7_9BACT|nr:AHH domain-containing protein [Archangium violaceum]KFA88002.1 hypothetical protein Q664_44050 [Archangium violaceum Cb vi76]
MAEPKHLDRNQEKRLGWFDKVKDGKPAYKDYKSSCKSGYRGPRYEAHHIVPDDMIDESVAEAGKSIGLQYLEDVMYITDWNINNPDNMIGLPSYHSYDQYYQRKVDLEWLTTHAPRTKVWVDWFNNEKAFARATRDRWLKLFNSGAINPEGLPIHNPSQWGHLEYDELLKTDLLNNVWNQVDAVRGEHKLDAVNVASALKLLQTKWRNRLVDRGQGANEDKWNRRHVDDPDDDWYVPFTMAGDRNPIFG